MVIDVHTHVLPGMDDGSASSDESIAMLREEAGKGIRTVVATPHFYARYDQPEEFFRRREAAMERLEKAMEGHSDLPEVKLGAEVYFFPGMSDSNVLQQLAIDGKRCVLVEMPMGKWTDRMYRELADIRSRQDLIPIVAHLDRYLNRFNAPGILRKLEELPVLIQANASFFLRPSTVNMAMKMLRRGQIHLLGSDCHNMDQRKPWLGEAVELIRQRLGEDVLKQIHDNQEFVFQG